ncbi:MAG: hypothetical protein ACOC3X_00230 [Nanoarchaeota archaeon]
MAFSKSFPKTTEKSTYPKWIEIFLTKREEENCELNAKKNNIELMKECIDDAKKIVEDKNLKKFQSDMIKIAISLFEKRASYAIHYKENLAKEKFDLEN